MCLILTLLAATVATLLWRYTPSGKTHRLGTLCLMYWGAALMWMVDGFFRLAEGEPFFDMTLNDALLGLLIIACGIVGWLLTLLWNRHKARAAETKA